MVKNYPLTTEDIAKKLGMTLGSFRVWKIRSEQDKKIKKASTNGYSMVDPENKNRLLFSQKYLNHLLDARKGVRKISTGDNRKSTVSITAEVKIFDLDIAEYLLKKFGSSKKIEEYLREHLLSLAKPALQKLTEIKKRHEKELETLLKKI